MKEKTSEIELKWKNEKETVTDIKAIKKNLDSHDAFKDNKFFLYVVYQVVIPDSRILSLSGLR